MERSSAANRDWNWHPALPIENSPIFDWPPRPLAALRWLVQSWLPLTTMTLWVVAALGLWVLLQPSVETMATFEWQWIAVIYARNFALLTLVAGGLHLYFYTLKAQGMERKFDDRPPPRNQRKYTFNSQVRDNMFWSLGCGVPVWTAFECIYFRCWSVALFLIIPIWSSMHFYWIHRLIHWKPLYRWVHSLHHRNIDVGPWSGISMYPVELVLYFSSVAIHFVVPSHPLHMMFHLYLEGLNPACSHSGYESVRVGGTKVIGTGDFFHQLHHRYFECNYGTATMPWDKWFGTFHDGSPEATIAAQARMRKMVGPARS